MFIMERIKIKERVKGWRGWREFIGLVREQNAMLGMFVHKKRVNDTRMNVLAWRDQCRCGVWVVVCHVRSPPARIGLVLRYKVLGEERVRVQQEGRRKLWHTMREQGKLD